MTKKEPLHDLEITRFWYDQHFNDFADLALTVAYVRAVEAGQITIQEPIDYDQAKTAVENKTTALQIKLGAPVDQEMFDQYLEEVLQAILPGFEPKKIRSPKIIR